MQIKGGVVAQPTAKEIDDEGTTSGVSLVNILLCLSIPLVAILACVSFTSSMLHASLFRDVAALVFFMMETAPAQSLILLAAIDLSSSLNLLEAL